MEIKENESFVDTKEEFTKMVVNALNKTGYAHFYKDYVPCTLSEAIEVARQFVRKRYYAKVIYFADGRAKYQSIVISKTPLEDTSARLCYSEMIY